MRKLILPVTIAATLGMSTLAMAVTDTNTTGVIKSLDAKACTVTLDNKTTYHFAKNCDFSKLKVGEKVVVSWHAYKKTDVGTKIVAA
jgi:hypothetical protein